MVVVDQVGRPLVGLSAQEAVEALEAAAEGPVAFRRGQVHLVFRAEVPLAHAVRAVAALHQHLGKRRVLKGNVAVRSREAGRALRDTRHAVRGVVASGQQTGAGGRAERRGMPLRVADAVLRDPVDVGRLDQAAVAAHRAESHVVEHDIKDIGCVLGSPGLLVGPPVGDGVPDVHVDRSRECLGHHVSPIRCRSRSCSPAAAWPRPVRSLTGPGPRCLQGVPPGRAWGSRTHTAR